jgi:hypothetical protein
MRGHLEQMCQLLVDIDNPLRVQWLVDIDNTLRVQWLVDIDNTLTPTARHAERSGGDPGSSQPVLPTFPRE